MSHSGTLGSPLLSGRPFSQLYNERQAHRLLSVKFVVWLLFGVRYRASLEESPFWTVTAPLRTSVLPLGIHRKSGNAPKRIPALKGHFLHPPASGQHSSLPDQIAWLYVLF